jgi:hypothetical protein
MNGLAGWIADTAREWGWRHTGWGVLVGSLSVFNMGSGMLLPSFFYMSVAWLYNVLQFGMPCVFALRVADRAVAAGASRGLAYAAVVLLVVSAGVWVFGPLLAQVLPNDPNWTLRDDFGLVTTRLLPFAVGTLAYAYWRRERDTLLRQRTAEVERARREQQVHSARLLALQARVEPQFLFDTLRRVRDQIGSANDHAEQLLGDLIALLRAIQPAAGATASTVGREFALVEAYGRASETRALRPPALTLAAADDAPQARFAPLVLLPALRRLAGDAPDAHWQVGASRQGDRLRMVIAPTASIEQARVALQDFDGVALRERLAAVHGPAADLSVDLTQPSLHIDAPLLQQEDAPHDPSPDR